MSAFSEIAYAKLNLALHVRGKRSDGYHDIETIFAFCEDGDALGGERSDEMSLEVAGPFGADVPAGEDNLVLRAATALQESAGETDGASLLLSKHLPVASGIGGGSADAGAALRLLTRLWSLDPALATDIAPSLGADVPACLRSLSCRGEGVGDRLEPVELGLAGTPVLLVHPGTALSTGAVFDRWDGLDRGSLGDWREGRNDLEAPAITLAPEIAEVLAWLGGRPGADFVRMSGSGATCFALFAGDADRDRAAAAVPGQWWRLATSLR